MRILFFNWRCPLHPGAGGAELLTQRIAERLVERGYPVTWFAASFPGAAPAEFISGVQFIRRGGQTSVHWHAWQWYKTINRGRFDVVIDEINTIPFFAPLYAGVPVIAFMMQLAREVWWYEAPPYLAPFGYVLEPLYLQVYRRTPVLTISASTAKGLQDLGLHGRVGIIPMATDFQAEASLPELAVKETRPTLAFVGRVVPSKRVDHMVAALALLHRLGVDAQLWVAGSGDAGYVARLEADIRKYGLRDSVRFWGKVSEAEKRDLYRRAHLLLACSVREGWGLTVTEANAVGTPAVVYDVPGLRDSTVHGRTGLVCASNTPKILAQTIAALWHQPEYYERLRQAAYAHSRALNWEATTDAFWDQLVAFTAWKH